MLYYELSNGESIGITTLNNEVEISLFNGSMVITYDIWKYKTLNNIISEIERDYKELETEDKLFQIYSNYD